MTAYNTIIEDARVLTADYLPNKMVHRDSERQEIANNLQPILEGEPPIDMLLYGPPGTGKTTMAKYVVKQLHKHSSELKSSTVNCFRQPSRFQAYYQIVTSMGDFVTRDGTATEQLVDMFEEKARKVPIVIILDEVDQITNEQILYDLARFQKVGLIMTANRQEVFAHLDERIRSSFSTRRDIRFSKYTEKELVDILKDRRKYGLKDSVLEIGQIEKIAEKSNGDARVAIGTLRIAAQKAENDDRDTITEEIIEESFSDAVEKNESLSLNKLNRHQRQMYDILKQNDEMSASDLFEKYRTEVSDPRSKRTLRRYLNKMEDYGLIEKHGEKRGRTYQLAE